MQTLLEEIKTIATFGKQSMILIPVRPFALPEKRPND